LTGSIADSSTNKGTSTQKGKEKLKNATPESEDVEADANGEDDDGDETGEPRESNTPAAGAVNLSKSGS
jgi:hypothetical protein